MLSYTRQSTKTETDYLKWTAGETKELTILSEQGETKAQHWQNNRSVPCTGDGCELCTAGVRYSLRWALKVRCNDKETTWEMSNRVFNNVEDLAEMQGTLRGMMLKVMRQGTSRETRYALLPMGIGDMTTKTETNIETRLRYAKDLCKTMNNDLQVTWDNWLLGLGARFVNEPKSVKVDAFIAYLERLAADADADAVSSDAQDDDIATMLDNL